MSANNEDVKGLPYLYSSSCLEKLSDNSQALANRLTMSRVIAA
jgi:hypothetical protein